MTRCGGWKVGLAALSSLIDLEMSVRMDLEELVCDTRRADPWGCWGCLILEGKGKEVSIYSLGNGVAIDDLCRSGGLNSGGHVDCRVFEEGRLGSGKGSKSKRTGGGDGG